MPEIETVAAVPAVEVEAVKEEGAIGNDVIVSGPTQDLSAYNEKKMAKVVKEGGKRGVEIEGAADMGGLQFFCTMMGSEITEGKVDLLVESMKAMNAISDPTEEERKGGAGKLGKMIFSFDEKVGLSAVAYVPTHQQEKCSAKEWLADVVLNVSSSKALVETIKTFEDQNVSEKAYAAIQIVTDGEKNIFPIKMRDPAISMAYNFLKSRDLFPADDDEDDDEYVFGDDDFP